jgi:uncharacterized protein with GYD domain
MATYIVISDWTDQGVAQFQETVDRYDAGMSHLEALGINVKERYWTLGDHDMVSIIDAPDAETLAAGLLKLASQGNIRTTTLRALAADEMKAVIAKVT